MNLSRIPTTHDQISSMSRADGHGPASFNAPVRAPQTASGAYGAAGNAKAATATVLQEHCGTFAVPIFRDQANTRLTIHIPLTDNTGVPFTKSSFRGFESLVLDLAGGFTQGGHVRGLWRADDRTFIDTNRVYVIVVPRKRAAAVAQALIHHVRSAFRQLAVYVELTPVRVAGF